MEGQFQDYVRSAGPFSQLESGLFCGPCQAGSHGPELGWTPWPLPEATEASVSRLHWREEQSAQEADILQHYLTKAAPVALSTFPPGILEVKKRITLT